MGGGRAGMRGFWHVGRTCWWRKVLQNKSISNRKHACTVSCFYEIMLRLLDAAAWKVFYPELCCASFCPSRWCRRVACGVTWCVAWFRVHHSTRDAVISRLVFRHSTTCFGVFCFVLVKSQFTEFFCAYHVHNPFVCRACGTTGTTTTAVLLLLLLAVVQQ